MDKKKLIKEETKKGPYQKNKISNNQVGRLTNFIASLLFAVNKQSLGESNE